MTQKTNKLYNLLTIPFLYSFIQKIFSGESVRKDLVRNYIKKKNVSVLDIGCGTAEILEILPGSKYFGYDIEPKYVNYAKLKYGKKGKFYCKKFTSKEIKKLPKFDYVLYFGVMHHLNNLELIKLIKTTKKVIKKSGKLITIDPLIIENQNIFARFAIKRDRGNNVRTENEYKKIIKTSFVKIKSKIIHQKFLPYTWFITISEK